MIFNLFKIIKIVKKDQNQKKWRNRRNFEKTTQEKKNQECRLRAFARTRAKKPNFFKFEIPNKQIDTHYCRYSMNCAHKFL